MRAAQRMKASSRQRIPLVCVCMCVCVCESKTQKWFLTFQLINLLQLNTFNDFWRWCLPHSVLFVFFIFIYFAHFLAGSKLSGHKGAGGSGSGKLWEPSLPFFAVIFSNWFNMRACLCVCVCVWLPKILLFYFISFVFSLVLCFRRRRLSFLSLSLCLLCHISSPLFITTLFGGQHNLYAVCTPFFT